MIETHYFLLELGRKKVPYETKEMTGGGGGVGVCGSGGLYRSRWDMVRRWR